jgi:glycosyltransferase involved in cell wall biosynthesis
VKFTVMIASYRGQRYIAEQVQSILKQKNVDVRLLISDDEQACQCAEFLQAKIIIASQIEQISVIEGPARGVNANFAHLIAAVDANQTNLYAFSDQDDVWLLDKLSTAEKKLNSSFETQAPQLYASRTMVCDEDLNPLFLSKGKPRPASFRNALLESIAGGNTMVFDYKTLKLLKKVNVPVHHDWLTYMVVTACGGNVLFDYEPYVLYRQHGANVIGANNGIVQKFYRLKKLLSNEFRSWAENNIKALRPIVDDMTAESRSIYEGFVRLHNMRGWHHCFARLSLFRKLGLYRQRRLEHYGFMFAAFLGKI